MNSTQTHFSALSVGNQLSIISKAAGDAAPVCKRWQLLSRNTKNHFSRLPNEYQIIIFSLATRYIPRELSKIALVCTKWRELHQVNSLWKPAFNWCVRMCTYDINLSSTENHKEQLEILIKTRLNDFKDLLIACAVKLGKPKSEIQEPTPSEVSYFLNKMDHTDLVKQLIAGGNLELVATLMLFKARFNANEIAGRLLFKVLYKNQTKADIHFIFTLMIKLGYSISSLFDGTITLSPNFITQFTKNFIFGFCNEIRVTNLIASGFILNIAESKNPNFSVLHELIPSLAGFYLTGQFKVPARTDHTPSFSDEKLKKHMRKTFSENELKEFVLDLLTKADLNLNILCPAQGWLRQGTALFQLRQLAERLPQGNAIAGALAEYDQAEQTNKRNRLKSRGS